MKPLSYLFHKIGLLTLCLLLCIGVQARHLTSTIDRTQHYLGLSVGGGMDLMIPQLEAKPKIGGAGNMMIHYEIQRHNFIFDVAAGADYQLGRMGIDSLVDSRDAKDLTGEQHKYQYRYSSYIENEKTLSGKAQVMVGARLSDYLYMLVGAKVQIPIMSSYSTKTDMATTGQYERWEAEYIENIPTYGFYPKSTYSYAGAIKNQSLWVAPTIEFGGYMPFMKRNIARASVYGSYGIRLGEGTGEIADYSNTNMNPKSQSQSDLSANLILNSLADSKAIGKLNNFEFGVRLTVLFNVTCERKICNCYE